MTEKLKGLKISVCQMDVTPGRPDLNTEYIIKEIKSAAKRGVDIIVFPEMCVSGYVIGDRYEDEAFVKDVLLDNKKIIKATKDGVVAIFGSIVVDEKEKGEDGRLRKFNAALVAQDGKLVDYAVKSLQPNYRFFNDDRHFFSHRKIVGEVNERKATSGEKSFLVLGDNLNPIKIKTKIGEVSLGVILCEDMWHMDYAHNPTKDLVKNGAEIVFNLSASPWTWQKNRKRHSVVKELLEESQVPFVYVNNTGTQNTGKNIVIFDGSSTIYNKDGNIVFGVEPYESGSHDFALSGKMQTVPKREQDDVAELYDALECAVKSASLWGPPATSRVVIGLSGGIDSAATAALYTSVFGHENVIAINMPSQYNSQATKDIAKEIAENLGIKYEVRPIQEIVDVIARATGVSSDSLTYENIQARVRMEILAARAQDEGCVFSANFNKVEAAFGYGTLYGDVAGFMAVLGDLVKREVYQLADYMNRVVYKKQVIPESCFTIAPTAELKNAQKDPFDYGSVDRHGYHDEMVRAITEFRCNPEWFIEQYLEGNLEKELRLESGTLKKLFTTPEDFVEDLEKNWKRFNLAFFKRVQVPPVPIVTKRAFGTDFRESIMSLHFTKKYNELKAKLLCQE